MSLVFFSLSASFDLRLVAIFACVLLQVQHAQSSICYDSTGVESNRRFSCQPDAPSSSCCVAGDICYSNGLCAPGPTITSNTTFMTPFFWVGCSDPTFAAAECFSECFKISGNGVQSCPQAGANRYCCYGLDGCNCSDLNQVFSLPPARILTTIDPAITATTSRKSSTSTSSSSLTSGSSSSATSISPAATPSTTLPHKNSNGGVAIGVGVGVGVPAAISIVALIYCLVRHRKKQMAARIEHQSMETKIQEVGGHTGHHEMGGNYNLPELYGVPPRQQYQELPADREDICSACTINHWKLKM